MKAALVYWSKSGNTEKVAKAIRQGLLDKDVDVSFWEVDEAELIEKFKKRPEGEITRLYPPYALGGQTKGFSLVEADDFMEVEKFYHTYAPLLEIKAYPIVDLTKIIGIRTY